MSESQAIATARRALGQDLARRRRDANLTQHKLADVVAYSRTTLANVEVGRQHAGRDFWQRADQAVDAAGALLRAHDALQHLIIEHRGALAETARERRFPSPQQVPENGDVQRREFLRVLSVAGAGLAVPVADDVRTRYVGSSVIDDYAEANAVLWRAFRNAKNKQLMMPLVREQLGTLTSHLNEAQTGAARHRLCGLAGDLFQLAGEVQFDGNRYGDAAQSYTLAAAASREAGAYDVWATAMVRHSFLSLYDHKPAEASPLLEAANRLARRGDSSLATRYWVAAVRAQVLAALGDLGGCRRALDEAEQVDRSTSPGGWLRFDASRLPEERGACYVELHRPDLAEPVLAKSLTAAISARRRGSVLVDLATAGVQRRDPERVVDCATQAIGLAAETSSGWVAQRLRGLRTQLQPMLGDSRIRALSADIR